MTLPTGTISMSQVNTELGLTSTTLISLNQTNVRTLAGVPSGAISMNDLRGKSAFTFAFNSGATFSGASSSALVTAEASFTFSSNGAIALVGDIVSGPTAWGSPLTTGIGSGYEFSVVVSTFSTSGGVMQINGTTISAPTTTPWVSLSSTCLVEAAAYTTVGVENVTSTGTIRIRHVSSGTTITRAYSLDVTGTD